MAGAGLHKWTDEETLTLIRLRTENEDLFTGRRNTAKKAWEEILEKMGLSEAVTPTQVAKKWDNLKRKYKELRCPATGTGTDRGEATAATWQYFTAMHEALGGRPSIDPPITIDSSVAAVASGSGSASTEAVQSQETVAVGEDPGSDSHSDDAEPSTSAGPPPRKKSRKSQVLLFLQEEAKKEEDRFNRQQEAFQRSTDKFLSLFEKLVNKDK